jgi:hypothetical protein
MIKHCNYLAFLVAGAAQIGIARAKQKALYIRSKIRAQRCGFLELGCDVEQRVLYDTKT